MYSDDLKVVKNASDFNSNGGLLNVVEIEGLTMLSVTSVKSEKRPFLNVKK